MTPLLLTVLLSLPQAPVPPVPAPPAQPTAAPAALSFASGTFPFEWDRILPLSLELDGLKVEQIFFNKRIVQPGFFNILKGAEFGTRAQVKVTNSSRYPRIPGFAVAVLDGEGRLLGVASGGTKIGTIKPGETETFDLNFTQVKERLSKGQRFLLSIELRN
jgi:hypothetical protein